MRASQIEGLLLIFYFSFRIIGIQIVILILDHNVIGIIGDQFILSLIFKVIFNHILDPFIFALIIQYWRYQQGSLSPIAIRMILIINVGSIDIDIGIPPFNTPLHLLLTTLMTGAP